MTDYLSLFQRALHNQEYVILDTETTGLNGQVVQIAIINHRGEVLLDTLVKPAGSIPPGATAIHGISDADVKDAPSWADVGGIVEDLICDKKLVVYNAEFDRMILYNTSRINGACLFNWSERATWLCAMLAFARYYGDWDAYRNSYRWQRLGVAAQHMGVPVLNAHSALGDCQMTLGITKALLAHYAIATNK